MPQKYQKLLEEAAQYEKCFGLNGLEKDGINLKNVRKQSDEMDEEYEILKLQHKNVELQSKINKNAKDIAQLKQDIEQARKSLRCQKPNPETIKEEMRTIKIKLASYEENYLKAKAKFTKLGIPDMVYPTSIEILVSQLTALKSQEMELKQLADDVMYTRQVRNKLNKLRL
ncbi:hypothetical protein EVAR_44528_1 [Eumeta japonica]|uniref:Uncharacterized protein n=1 Tax=Eumeta variegata TaxID=151549 RepID=A0A4C1YHJ1_EUMVA|nr:hypothetical protein EVAR_44528_1 [Eumeta japonica]